MFRTWRKGKKSFSKVTFPLPVSVVGSKSFSPVLHSPLAMVPWAPVDPGPAVCPPKGDRCKAETRQGLRERPGTDMRRAATNRNRLAKAFQWQIMWLSQAYSWLSPVVRRGWAGARCLPSDNCTTTTCPHASSPWPWQCARHLFRMRLGHEVSDACSSSAGDFSYSLWLLCISKYDSSRGQPGKIHPEVWDQCCNPTRNLTASPSFYFRGIVEKGYVHTCWDQNWGWWQKQRLASALQGRRLKTCPWILPPRSLLWDSWPGCQKWCSRAHIPSDSPTWGHSHSWCRNPRQMLAQLHAPFQRLSQAPCTAHSSDCWLKLLACKTTISIFDFLK